MAERLGTTGDHWKPLQERREGSWGDEKDWSLGGFGRLTHREDILNPYPKLPKRRENSNPHAGWSEIALALEERDKAQKLPRHSGNKVERPEIRNVEAQPDWHGKQEEVGGMLRELR